MSCTPFQGGYACSIDLFAQESKPKEVKKSEFDLKRFAAMQKKEAKNERK